MVIRRPECPELDESQLKDLEEFFRGRSVDELERHLSDLQNGVRSDVDVTANVNQAFIMLQNIIDEKKS